MRVSTTITTTTTSKTTTSKTTTSTTMSFIIKITTTATISKRTGTTTTWTWKTYPDSVSCERRHGHPGSGVSMTEADGGKWNKTNFPWSKDCYYALQQVWRTDQCGLQLQAINASMAGKDALVLMPTGGGKFVLPAPGDCAERHNHRSMSSNFAHSRPAGESEPIGDRGCITWRIQ